MNVFILVVLIMTGNGPVLGTALYPDEAACHDGKAKLTEALKDGNITAYNLLSDCTVEEVPK